MWNSAVALFGIIFVVEIAQKQEIWRLKRKSPNVNFLFIEQLYTISYHICNHADFWRKKRHSSCDN